MSQPSPGELYARANGDRGEYIRLMKEAGYLIEGKREPLPCGWPDRRVALSEIREFKGRWAFLSNFHPAVLVWEGIQYPTSEHAFNAGKSLDMGERAWIAAASTPREAKRRGRTVKLRPWWDAEVRFTVMAEVLAAKFRANPDRVHALLSTRDALLVEGNTWHDQTWGDCRCGRRACIDPGRNALGVLLMGLRSDLRDEGPEPHHLAHQNPAGEYDPNCPACTEATYA